jgi:hypothetical protein
MSKFKFEIGQQVKLVWSDECGQVIGRAEYSAGEALYQIRYRAGDKRQTEAWWGESAVEANGAAIGQAVA